MINRKKSPNDVSWRKFYAMILEMRADFKRGLIDKYRLKIVTYLNRYHFGHYPTYIIKELVLCDNEPSFEDCKKGFEEMKRKYRKNVDLRKQLKTINTAVQHTLFPFEESQKIDYVLSEESAIEYLKSKGYIILKRF